MAKKFYGWQVVAALAGVYFISMGFPLYGGSVINSLMLKDITMDRSTYGLGFTLLNFTIGTLSLLVAAFISRWGIRWSIIFGNALIMIGALWMAFIASKPWHFLLGFGIVISAGISFATVLPTTTGVSRWFARLRGRAMALMLTAPAIAGIIAAPSMNWVVAVSGGNWRNAWLVVAGAMVLSILISYFFVKESPQDYDQIPDGELLAEPVKQTDTSKMLFSTYDWTPKEAYRTISYWMVLIGACACQFPFFFFVAHWIPFMRGLEFSPASAAFTMGLYTVGGLVGRLMGGWLMDKIAARYCFIIGLVVYLAASAIAVMTNRGDLMLAYCGALSYGFGFGWTFVSFQTVTAHFYGAKAYHKLNGTIMLLSAILCAGAGVIGGRIFDVFKSYTPAFELNAVLAVVGIVAMIFAKMPQPQNQTNTSSDTISS